MPMADIECPLFSTHQKDSGVVYGNPSTVTAMPPTGTDAMVTLYCSKKNAVKVSAPVTVMSWYCSPPSLQLCQTYLLIPGTRS